MFDTKLGKCSGNESQNTLQTVFRPLRGYKKGYMLYKNVFFTLINPFIIFFYSKKRKKE